MKNTFAGILAVMMMVLFGCGGGSSGTTTDTGVKKAAVSGTVSFPVLGSLVGKLVGKQVASTTPTGPVLTITDLNGNVIATPTLIVDPTDSKKYTYTVSLDASKDYVLKASWGGEVLKSLADRSTLSTLTTEINVTPVSTAAVLVTEQKLGVASGTLGTATSTTTATQLADINPAAILDTVTTSTDTTYTALVAAVTTALIGLSDPATVTTVTTAASSAASTYTAPLQFTLAMISGKSFKADSGSTITFQTDGTVTTSKNSNVNYWLLNPDGTILLSYLDSTTKKAGWDKFTLIQNTNPTSLVISDLNIDGTTSPNATWTYYTPTAGFTTAMISSKTFNYSDTAGNFGTPTFNANGTYSVTNGDSGTWRINATGQLVLIEASGGTDTMTLTATTGTVITASDYFAHGDGTFETFTVTLTAVTPTTTAFTSAMISGKTFNYSDTAGNYGIFTFSANGNYTTASGNSGTWSINASGQVVVIEVGETSTATLVSNTGTVITATIVSSTAGTYTATLTAVTTTNITVADYAKLVGYSRYIDYPNTSHTHYYDGVQSVSGRSVNVLREVDDVGSVLKETIYVSSDITTGAYFLGGNGTFFVNPYPVVLPSFVPGQEYGPYDIYGDGSDMVYITWTFEDVTVPYGTFTNALKQKTRHSGASNSTWFNWYAKDMGGVKWQDASTVDNEVLIDRNFIWPNSGAVTAQW